MLKNTKNEEVKLVKVTERLKAWLKVTLEAKGLVAALCICAIGIALIPWAEGGGVAVGAAMLCLLFLGYRIADLLIIMVNEKKDEKKEEREERLLQTILKKCTTAEEVQQVLGEQALKDIGEDIVRKRQTKEWWGTSD